MANKRKNPAVFAAIEQCRIAHGDLQARIESICKQLDAGFSKVSLVKVSDRKVAR